MKSETQIFQSYKKKKMKYDDKLNGDIEKMDTLFNLVIKYFLPLKPEKFNFCLSGSKIFVNSEIKSHKLKLELDTSIQDSEKEAIFFLKNSSTEEFGSGRTKKVLLLIKEKLEK